MHNTLTRRALLSTTLATAGLTVFPSCSVKVEQAKPTTRTTSPKQKELARTFPKPSLESIYGEMQKLSSFYGQKILTDLPEKYTEFKQTLFEKTDLKSRLNTALIDKQVSTENLPNSLERFKTRERIGSISIHQELDKKAAQKNLEETISILKGNISNYKDRQKELTKQRELAKQKELAKQGESAEKKEEQSSTDIDSHFNRLLKYQILQQTAAAMGALKGPAFIPKSKLIQTDEDYKELEELLANLEKIQSSYGQNPVAFKRGLQELCENLLDHRSGTLDLSAAFLLSHINFDPKFLPKNLLDEETRNEYEAETLAYEACKEASLLDDEDQIIPSLQQSLTKIKDQEIREYIANFIKSVDTEARITNFLKKGKWRRKLFAMAWYNLTYDPTQDRGDDRYLRKYCPVSEYYLNKGEIDRSSYDRDLRALMHEFNMRLATKMKLGGNNSFIVEDSIDIDPAEKYLVAAKRLELTCKLPWFARTLFTTPPRQKVVLSKVFFKDMMPKLTEDIGARVSIDEDSHTLFLPTSFHSDFDNIVAHEDTHVLDFIELGAATPEEFKGFEGLLAIFGHEGRKDFEEERTRLIREFRKNGALGLYSYDPNVRHTLNEATIARGNKLQENKEFLAYMVGMFMSRPKALSEISPTIYGILKNSFFIDPLEVKAEQAIAV